MSGLRVTTKLSRKTTKALDGLIRKAMESLEVTNEEIEQFAAEHPQNPPLSDGAKRQVKTVIEKIAAGKRVLELEAQLASERAAREGAEEKRDYLKNHTYCTYCGQSFDCEDPQAKDLVTEHIRTCEKHPIFALSQERDAMSAQVAAAVKALQRHVDWFDLGFGDYHDKYGTNEFEPMMIESKALIASPPAAAAALLARVEFIEKERDHYKRFIELLADAKLVHGGPEAIPLSLSRVAQATLDCVPKNPDALAEREA